MPALKKTKNIFKSKVTPFSLQMNHKQYIFLQTKMFGSPLYLNKVLCKQTVHKEGSSCFDNFKLLDITEK